MLFNVAVPIFLFVSRAVIVRGDAVPFNQLFNIGPQCNAQQLQGIANDAQALMVAANRAIFSSAQDVSIWAQQYMLAFFKILKTDQQPRVPVYTAIRQVQDFLEQGTPALGPNIRSPGWIFCGNAAFTRVYPSDNAVQRDGTPLIVNGNPVTVGAAYQPELAYFMSREPTPPRIYFVSDGGRFNEYIIEAADQFDYFTNDYCGGPVDDPRTREAGLGKTVFANNAFAPFIVLCSESFNIIPDRASGAKTARLGGIDPAPAAGATLDGVQQLSDVVPVALTFLHELFHYVPASHGTRITDFGADGYVPAFVMGPQFSQQQAMQNAESYALFALASWYTINKRAVAGGVPYFISYARLACQYYLERTL